VGRFIYDTAGTDGYPIDDRLLAHVELAISVKFRRGESFAFTLAASDLKAGQGQRVFWMHPSIPVQFQYDHDRHDIVLNLRWVERLIEAAFTDTGLRIIPEPAAANDSHSPARRRPEPASD